jgi:hypothetical protein
LGRPRLAFGVAWLAVSTEELLTDDVNLSTVFEAPPWDAILVFEGFIPEGASILGNYPLLLMTDSDSWICLPMKIEF